MTLAVSLTARARETEKGGSNVKQTTPRQVDDAAAHDRHTRPVTPTPTVPHRRSQHAEALGTTGKAGTVTVALMKKEDRT